MNTLKYGTVVAVSNTFSPIAGFPLIDFPVVIIPASRPHVSSVFHLLAHSVHTTNRCFFATSTINTDEHLVREQFFCRCFNVRVYTVAFNLAALRKPGLHYRLLADTAPVNWHRMSVRQSCSRAVHHPSTDDEQHDRRLKMYQNVKDV